MKRLLKLAPLMVASLSLAQANANFYRNNDSEVVVNKVYNNILAKNLSGDCKDLFLAYSKREEMSDVKSLVGLDIGMANKVYNLGAVRDVELSPDGNTAYIYAYDSDYSNSSSILETLKEKNIIDETLKGQIEEALNFQPRYKIVVDTKTNTIKSIHTGYKMGDNFKRICGK